MLKDVKTSADGLKKGKNVFNNMLMFLWKDKTKKRLFKLV